MPPGIFRVHTLHVFTEGPTIAQCGDAPVTVHQVGKLTEHLEVMGERLSRLDRHSVATMLRLHDPIDVSRQLHTPASVPPTTPGFHTTQ